MIVPLRTTGSHDGGPLMVSGGGSTAVATDELIALCAGLRDLALHGSAWSDTLGALRWSCTDAALDDAVGTARSRAAAIAAGADGLAGRLAEAADAYGAAERAGARIREQVGGILGWFAGFLGLAIAPALLVTGAAVTAEVLLAWIAVQGVRRLRGDPVDDPAEWLQRHAGVINSPATVAVLRVLVSSVDDMAAGAVRVPLPVARGLGDSGAGVVGVDTSAMGVLLLGGLFGFLRETPVRSREVGEDGERLPSRSRRGADTGPPPGRPVAPPSGIGGLLDRVPTASVDGPQVRIERYDDAEGTAWVAYIGGTVSWDAGDSSEPWDLTSNVHGVAGSDTGSYRAVIDALEQAGVDDGDRVLAVGHSQGGLLAARLAADERFAATGLVTAGAPIGQVDLPGDVPVLQLEHTDDLVPALGGFAPEDPSPEHLMVRREFLADRAEPVTGWVPAHDLSGYRETARVADASADPRLERIRTELGRISGSGSATWWRGERR
ncbi:MAG: hypothetical protein ABWY36_06705 [Leifsonia sp.]